MSEQFKINSRPFNWRVPGQGRYDDAILPKSVEFTINLKGSKDKRHQKREKCKSQLTR